MYLSILFHLYLIVCFSLLYYFGVIIIIYKIIKSQEIQDHQKTYYLVYTHESRCVIHQRNRKNRRSKVDAKRYLGYRWITWRFKESSERCMIKIRFLSKLTLSRAGKTINWLLKGPRRTHQRCNNLSPTIRELLFPPQAPLLPAAKFFSNTTQAWNIKSSIFLHNAAILRSQLSPFPLPAYAIDWSYCSRFLSMENLRDVTKFLLTRYAKWTIKKIISIEVYMYMIKDMITHNNKKICKTSFM